MGSGLAESALEALQLQRAHRRAAARPRSSVIGRRMVSASCSTTSTVAGATRLRGYESPPSVAGCSHRGFIEPVERAGAARPS